MYSPKMGGGTSDKPDSEFAQWREQTLKKLFFHFTKYILLFDFAGEQVHWYSL